MIITMFVVVIIACYWEIKDWKSFNKERKDHDNDFM